ncbi:hypothetical protein C2S51_016794 [Perilla frutescens var. frutescens]|nr:hypothetical protein C2S51_016794 [Perilla frutescens var. frutescens]
MEDSILHLQKPTGVSHSLLASRKRRPCGLDSSEVWINMGKTNPECSHLDEYTRKTESAQLENAILGDCEIEVQEQGEGWGTTSSRGKRTRCMYSPSRVDGGSLKLSSAAEQISSKSTECDSSASNSEDPGSDQVSEPSGRNIRLLAIDMMASYVIASAFSSVLLLIAGVVGRKRLKLKEELKCRKDQQTFNVKDQDRDVVNTKTGEYLDFEVEKLHQSSFASNCVEATSSFLNPVNTGNQHLMEIVLVDVQLTVDASPQAEDVPFVSLTSGAYGIAVIGYPIDVGEIRDGSETLLLSKESGPCELFGDGGSRLEQLVWKTSRRRRTPVCYVTSPLSASISKNVEGSILPDGENGLLRNGKSVMKLVNNRKTFNQGKTSLNKTCVPVELIFSKILAAVDQVQS